jgi:hypothetical protein
MRAPQGLVHGAARLVGFQTAARSINSPALLLDELCCCHQPQWGEGCSRDSSIIDDVILTDRSSSCDLGPSGCAHVFNGKPAAAAWMTSTGNLPLQTSAHDAAEAAAAAAA